MSRRALLRNSLVYVILGFLPLAVNFLLAPVYSEYIPPDEYGLIALATIFQGFLTVFITYGLDGAFSRIFFDYHSEEREIAALMSTTLLTISAGALACFGVLYFAGDFLFSRVLQNSEFTYSKYGYIVFFTTYSTAVHAVFLSYYRNREEAFKFSLVSLSFFLTSIGGILIGIVYLRAEALGNIAGKAAGTTLVSVLLLLTYFLANGVKFRWEYLKISLKYSLPLMPYLLILMAYNNIDKFMIEQYFDLEALGLYNFAFLLASVLSVLIYAIFNAISPRIYKLLTEGGRNDIEEVKKLNLLFHLVVLGLITLGIAIVIPVLETVISQKYQSIRDYVGILIIVYVFQVYYVIYTIPLFFHKKTGSLPWISLIVLVVGIVSNIIFIPIFGIYGVCLSLFLTKMAQFFIAYAFVRRYSLDGDSYLQMNKNHITSAFIIFSYGIALLASYLISTFPIAAANVIPLGILIISVLIFFRKDLVSYKRLIKRVIVR